MLIQCSFVHLKLNLVRNVVDECIFLQRESNLIHFQTLTFLTLPLVKNNTNQNKPIMFPTSNNVKYTQYTEILIGSMIRATCSVIYNAFGFGTLENFLILDKLAQLAIYYLLVLQQSTLLNVQYLLKQPLIFNKMLTYGDHACMVFPIEMYFGR